MSAPSRRSGETTERAARSDGSALGTRRRLAGFARTLRDNGFRVGLAETRDALQVLASPAAIKPSALKPALRALFCATHSDWERFDKIFDAFWRGHDMRTRQILSGMPSMRAMTRTGICLEYCAAASQRLSARNRSINSLQTARVFDSNFSTAACVKYGKRSCFAGL